MGEISNVTSNEILALTRDRQFHDHVVRFVFEVRPPCEGYVGRFPHGCDEVHDDSDLFLIEAKMTLVSVAGKDVVVFLENRDRNRHCQFTVSNKARDLVRSTTVTGERLKQDVGVECDNHEIKIAYLLSFVHCPKSPHCRRV